MLRRRGGVALKKAMGRTALLLALARTSGLVPEGGILRGRVHVVLEGDATPPPGGAVQVVLGTSEIAEGGWGDGAHPSTALCLEWLSERGFKGDEAFLDYGCGSGVLAIAARKLGCPTAVGVDVEYEALDSAAENAERNGITDGVDWVHGRSIVPGNDEYDAVVANILVGQLSRPSMVATLALGTKVGGALCLSGIRPDQCAVLERLYAPCTARRLAVPSRPATPSPRRSRASPVDPRRLRRRREDLPRPGRFWKGVLGLLGEARADAKRSRSTGAPGADQRRRRARLM